MRHTLHSNQTADKVSVHITLEQEALNWYLEGPRICLYFCTMKLWQVTTCNLFLMKCLSSQASFLTLLALGGGVFHVNFVCLLITFLVLGRLPPNLVTFHNWVLAKFSISKIKNRRFLVAMVTNLSRVVFCQNQ